jgi:pimeloyl-ACP methyl ester carboxylesterase
VIVGTEDRVTPPAEAVAISEAIPGAELVAIERSGHLSNLEGRQTFNTAVSEFLAKVGDRPAA